MRLTPGQDRIATESTVRTDPDLDFGPAGPNLRYHPFQLVGTAGGGILIGRAKTGPQNVIACSGR